MRIDVQSIS